MVVVTVLSKKCLQRKIIAIELGRKLAINENRHLTKYQPDNTHLVTSFAASAVTTKQLILIKYEADKSLINPIKKNKTKGKVTMIFLRNALSA